MTARVEIATTAAAQAFAERTQPLPEFELLFARLESAGFPIGIEGRLRSLALISRLVGMGVRVDDPAQLFIYLLPTLATSQHELADMRRLFDEWIRPEGGGAVQDDKVRRANAQSAIPREIRQLERADRQGLIAGGSLAGVAVLAFVGLIAVRTWSGSAPSLGSAATDVVTYSQPVVSLGAGLHPAWKAFFEDVLSRLAFALVVLGAGLSFAAWRRDVKGRLVRRVGETDLASTFSMKLDIPRWFRTVEARAAFDRLKRVRWSETNVIDVAATIANTVRAGGRPVVAMQRRRELPNYVLIVDRAAGDDHAGLFARLLEGALAEASIVYSRYDFTGSLDRLNPVRGGLHDDIVDYEFLPFSLVASRHAGERLITVSAGTAFFELPGIRIDRAGHRSVVRPGTAVPDLLHIREFSAAFLITSAPKAAWGENERRLEELGFSIFTADVAGIDGLAAQLMQAPEAGAAPGLGTEPREEHFLDRLARNPTRLMSGIPPQRDEIHRLVNDLKVWAADKEVYTLLAAIAAFPKIDARITFVLARLVLQSRNGEIDSALFGRLVRLPWIREGRMPDWLRIAIINGLRQEQRDLVRKVQVFVLAQAEAVEGAGETSALDRLVAAFEVAREITPAKLDAVTSSIQLPDLPSGDERIFFSLLRNEKLDPERDVLQPEASAVIQERMEAPERRRRTQLRYLAVACAVLAAALQPWISDVLIGIGAAADIAAVQLHRPLYGLEPTPPAVRVAALAAMFVALAHWAFTTLRSGRSSEFDRLSSRYGPTLAVSVVIPLGVLSMTFPFPSTTFGSSEPLLGRIMMAATFAVTAWVWFVTPQRWQRSPSADDTLDRQLQRDALTASLGTVLVTSIWAVPWFLVVLSGLAQREISMAALVLLAATGTAAWVASNALMRRWLLGPTFTLSWRRVWLDVGFAGVVFVWLAALVRIGALTDETSWLFVFALTVSTTGAYTVATWGNLGIQDSSQAWRPFLTATMAASLVLAVLVALFITAASSIQMVAIVNDIVAIFLIFAGVTFAVSLVCGSTSALAIRWSAAERSPFFFRRSVKRAFLLSVLVAAATSGLVSVFFASSVLESILTLPFLVGVTLDYLFVFLTAFLPIALVLWPVFRFVGPAALVGELSAAARTPRLWWWQDVFADMATRDRIGRLGLQLRQWRRIVVAGSPWWSTLAMWLLAVTWRIGDSTFSLWPLALPVAVALAWRHGGRATAAIAAGVLPFALQLGPAEAPVTPGGVWPALVILFWARFAADISFRQQLLRREILPWAEAALIVVLLASTVRLRLDLIDIPTALRIEPSWMIATVALVIGASRMPAQRFVVALLVGWVVIDVARQLSGAVRAATTIGVRGEDVLTALLVLYGMRAWRRYATEDQFDPERLRPPVHGNVVVLLLGVAGGILVSGLVPEISFAGVGWLLMPTSAGLLAAAIILGLSAANLWKEPVFNLSRRPALSVPIAFGNMIILGSVYGFATSWWGNVGTSRIGIGFQRVTGDVLLGELGSIGVAVCLVGFAIFGAAVRIVSEQRSEEASWRATVARLWRRPDRSRQPPDDRDSRRNPFNFGAG